jgi:hypothetical protein
LCPVFFLKSWSVFPKIRLSFSFAIDCVSYLVQFYCFSRDFHRVSRSFLWDLWCFCDLSTRLQGDVCGISMGLLGILWYFCGISLWVLCYFHSISIIFLWNFYGIPVGFLWDFYDISMGFLHDF